MISTKEAADFDRDGWLLSSKVILQRRTVDTDRREVSTEFTGGDPGCCQSGGAGGRGAVASSFYAVPKCRGLK
jgi:hypothetical protein